MLKCLFILFVTIIRYNLADVHADWDYKYESKMSIKFYEVSNFKLWDKDNYYICGSDKTDITTNTWVTYTCNDWQVKVSLWNCQFINKGIVYANTRVRNI